MKNILLTIGLLILSNGFMTMAWYGHLKFFGKNAAHNPSLFVIILFSWGLAFFEYCFQVPANRIGFVDEGGPFNLVQLKVIQEVITLLVFTLFSLIFFKNISFRWNHLVAFGFLVGAVYFIFKK
ncbi:MAG TPA: DMT family protein [Puia sp.]|nr:DMT family protein [Puia sp.]